jgi:hypothetical protein
MSDQDKSKNKKIIVFSEEIDNRINKLALGLTFTSIGILLFLGIIQLTWNYGKNNNYLLC